MQGWVEDRWYAKNGSPKARCGTGNRWLVRYATVDGTERRKSFARKQSAEAYLADMRVQVLRGEWVDPTLGQITVAALAQEWLPTQMTKSPRYVTRQQECLNLHILPRFGTVPVNHVSTPDVEAWLASLLLPPTSLSPATVRYVHGVFKRLMGFAVRGDRLRRNRVAEAANIPRRPQTRHHRYLTHAQVWALADHAVTAPQGSQVLRATILTTAYTGLRYGELIGLNVSDFDARRGRLHVDKQYEGAPLKDHAKRTVPLPAPIVEELVTLMGGRMTGPLFPAPRGGRWQYKRYRERFDAACRAADIHGLTPHGLRHTAASLAVQAGASVKSVQRMLGHQSATLTLDTYSDLFDGDLDDVAHRMSAMAEGFSMNRPQTAPALATVWHEREGNRVDLRQ